jgi:hypothetical protein
MKAEVQAEILEIVAALPDDAELEDVMKALQARVKINRGVDDLNAGRTCSSQELLERYRTKLPL